MCISSLQDLKIQSPFKTMYIYFFLTHKAYNLIMDCTLYSVFRLIESAVRMQMHTCESWLIFVASCHVGGLFSEIIVLLQLAAIVFDADLDV